MKVSLNTVKQYTDVNLPIDELVHKVNSQLGGVEEVIDLATKYKDAVIVKIVTCEKHPNADKLKICMIDAGDDPRFSSLKSQDSNLIQVVCGAPNARAGIYAVWLPPKSTVPASFDEPEPFVLDVRELRGILSQGMLAAPDELAISSEHDGILEIDPDEWSPKQSEIKPGANFAKVFGLDDTILDIENKMFTHRPDCFGVLGVAREIAGIQHNAFKSPEWYTRDPEFQSGDGLKLTVTNDAIEKAPRFMAVAIKNVAIKQSPLWLQCELVRLGAKPINNIVDVTNYVMLLTGQPTHAYDYDKLRSKSEQSHESRVTSHGKQLGVRLAKKGEKITLLNHKEYELDESDLVIVDGEGPVGLAGIMGGGESEVSSDTKNIVLECASFDMYALRKSSMRHGVFTDALTRFNKGQSPLQNPYILDLLIRSVFDVAGGELASHIFDQSARLKPHTGVKVTIDFINERLGLKLSAEEAAKLLKNVEFTVQELRTKNQELVITPPFWRTDIELPEDVVEEVGRLYGFDRLPRELPVRSITPIVPNITFEARRRIRHTLARLGANEVLTYSFVHENLLRRAEQDVSEAFRLSNALSPDLQYYRLSLTPSLLAQVHPNIKAGHDEFMIFEIGKAHGKSEMDEAGLPKEFGRIAGVYAAGKKTAKDRQGSPYFVAKRYLGELCDGRDLIYTSLNDSKYKDHKLFQQMIAPYDKNRSAAIHDGERLVGVVGEFKASLITAFKLQEYSAGFELFLSAFERAGSLHYRPLSRFPSVSQDISLKVSENKNYHEVAQLVADVVSEHENDECVIAHDLISIYQPPSIADTTYSFRIKMTHMERTLTDQDATKIVDAIASRAQTIGAERI